MDFGSPGKAKFVCYFVGGTGGRDLEGGSYSPVYLLFLQLSALRYKCAPYEVSSDWHRRRTTHLIALPRGVVATGRSIQRTRGSKRHSPVARRTCDEGKAGSTSLVRSARGTDRRALRVVGSCVVCTAPPPPPPRVFRAPSRGEAGLGAAEEVPRVDGLDYVDQSCGCSFSNPASPSALVPSISWEWMGDPRFSPLAASLSVARISCSQF